ncbi:MAG: alpha/beta hydrolase [Bacteroidia bacterium]|nr:alpha/beta hydrolase [Bacteroidia bacterium]
MPYITNTQNKAEVKLYYRDLGKGQPVILIHGWPLNGDSWESQINALTDAGFRCIAYDRRGFGKSDVASEAYDYDALASDLHAIIEELQLDQVILAGFSMGGGEVVRYLTKYGSAKVAKVALIASIIPLVAQKSDNPEGVPQEKLNEIMQALKTDRVGFLQDFHKNFYNVGMLNKPVSQGRLDADFIVSSQASGHATIKCAEAWGGTDFRPELKSVTVPALIVHGDADQIVPIKTAGEQAAKGIANHEYHVIEGAPHGLNVTHAEELNTLLVAFCKK